MPRREEILWRAAEQAFRAAQQVAHRKDVLAGYLHPTGPGIPLALMIHGFEGDPAEFNDLCAEFRRRAAGEIEPAIVDGLAASGGQTPEENTRRVHDYLAENDLLSRDVVLIGHSLGGLVARRYCHWPGVPHVRGMVMISTPNGGVNAGNVLPWIGSKDFDARFNDRWPPPSGVPHLLAYGTTGANVVEGLPNDYAVGRWSVIRLLHYADDNTPVEIRDYPLDHWRILVDEELIRDVVAFSRRAVADSAGPGADSRITR